RIAIDPRREKFYWTGAYELEVQRALVRVLRPGMRFWDIGAHAGFMTLLASRIVGESGGVLAFEPASETRARLVRNIRINGIDNVDVCSQAVSAASGTATLFAHAASSMWTLVPELGDRPSGEVECTTLNDLTAAHGAPDIVKIDVEGAETDVLAGGTAMLDPGSTVFIVEFSSADALARAREMCRTREFTQIDAAHWILERAR
ncbi:MAG: FkbM family methyltransferase, partial [Gaiellaceae bacterium]